jgi:hypothetical protein
VGDALALDIDEEDLVKGEVLALSQRADFFKMQGPVGGVGDTVPLLSVGDFGLSVESLVQDAGGGQKGNDGLSKKGGRNKSRKKKSKAWVYVENMANGKFKRVPMSRLGYARLTDVEEDMEARRLGASRRDGPDLMTHRAHDITAFVSGVFQFAQGLLAGLSLLHLFLVQSITSYGTFQSVYQPLANESRRLYFVLASLGFASSIETYLRESENKELWSTLSVLQKVRIFVLGVLYVTTLGLSLAMMPTDTMIAISPADVSPESLSVWGVFEYIRSISSIIGWILVCIAVHEENQNGRLLLLHCSNLTREMDKQKLRLQNVSGKHLDSASPEELEELVAIQKAAVKSTERAIEFYRRRMENRVLTAGSP